VKAGATAEALGRILPNVGGAREKKKRLLAAVVTNQLLYAAPIWADALKYAHNVEKLLGPQRKVALRCIMAYRTVSMVAALVVSGMIPTHLAAIESQKRYNNRRQGILFDDAEERAITIDKWQQEWQNADAKTEDGPPDL